MSKQINALRLALEALESLDMSMGLHQFLNRNKAITAIKEALEQTERGLKPRCFSDFQQKHEHDRKCKWCAVEKECKTVMAQPEQEPVAWAMLHDNGDFIDAINLEEHARIEGDYKHALYTTPPQPKEPEQRPVEWMPIEQMYPQTKAIDILMRDGSILCGVWPQFDGDLWWEGSGTGEKFIDPKYANVTHWRIHDEYEDSKTWVWLTDKDRQRAFESMPDMLDGFLKTWGWLHFAKAIEEISKEKNT